MLLLHSGTERCALQPGTYTVGGKGANALPISSLEMCAAVAMIVVPDSGPSTIQRIAASVVVRLDRVPLGIAPKELNDGVQIEFNEHCLTFASDAGGQVAVASAPDADETGEGPTREALAISAPVPIAHAVRARIVNARTADVIALNGCRVVVGRDETCDLVLSGMSVSRRHFSVTPVEGGYLLRDESANGTLVNGSRVSGTYLLGHGDVLRLDEHELRFEVDGAASSAPSAEAEPTAILDMSRLRAEYKSDAKRKQSHVPLTATLEIVRGHYAGASFSVDRPVCSIGRGPESDVRIRDESVSTNHATLLRKGSSWYVVDLRSANGTCVNGSRIAGERELTSGSRIKLGSVEMVFRSHDAGDAPVETTRKRSWLVRLSRLVSRPAASAEGE
jgi:pSer/pThr/pTyr-binding forkhead associated (FHA) protein